MTLVMPSISYKFFQFKYLVFPLLLSSCSLSFVSAQTEGITITWDINSEADIAGYKVYYGESSRIYTNSIMVGLNTEYTFPDLTGLSETYIAITAYDINGNESKYSTELLISMSQPGKQFSLGEAYPNPFNPVTQIPYFLPSEFMIF